MIEELLKEHDTTLSELYPQEVELLEYLATKDRWLLKVAIDSIVSRLMAYKELKSYRRACQY